MAIRVNLDVVMAQRRVSAGDLAEKIGITPANLSILKNNKAKAVRFSTLEELCRALDCQPGDILQFDKD
jgi:putative transcriptional regulator